MSVREVLDPLFENMAFGYNKNDLDDIDWDAAVYNGLIGAFLGSTSNIVSTVNNNFNSKNSTPKLNSDEVISGMWEDSPNSSKNNVEKSQLESVESFDESDIIIRAKEYLQSPEGQKDTRPYLKHRPAYAKNQIETVFESGKDEFGKVYDPSGKEVLWDRSKPRNGQWDMGHIPGQKYSVVHAKYVLGMMTSEEFAHWYRDPQNYIPELPSTNRGHKHE